MEQHIEALTFCKQWVDSHDLMVKSCTEGSALGLADLCQVVKLSNWSPLQQWHQRLSMTELADEFTVASPDAWSHVNMNIKKIQDICGNKFKRAQEGLCGCVAAELSAVAQTGTSPSNPTSLPVQVDAGA